MTDRDAQDRLHELSRLAAAQRASAEELAELSRLLKAQPERQADIDWDAAYAAQLRSKVSEMPPLPGWERTQRLLQDESNKAITSKPANRSAQRILDRCSDWLSSLLGFSVNVQALAVGVIVAQVGVIGLLATQAPDSPFSEIRSGTGAGPNAGVPAGPLLRVSFRADLREAELRRVLTGIGGEIVGGPGQLGIYLIRVREGDLQSAADRLRASGAVELVELVAPGQ